METRQRRQGGMVLLSTLFAAALIVSWLSVSSNYIATEANLARQHLQITQASSIAEAGLQHALQQLATSRTNYAPITNQPFGEGSYSVTFTAIVPNVRYNITSTGITAQGRQRIAHAIVRQTQTVNRLYAGFGAAGISLNAGKTGSYNSSTNPNASFGIILVGTDGDVASLATISLDASSQIRGKAWVKNPATDISGPLGQILEGAQTLASYTAPTADFSQYSALPVLPDCQPMPAGTYRDWGSPGYEGLSISGGVECYTDGTGPVTVYVRGPLTLTGGALSGYAGMYRSPKNLTLIVEPRPGHEAGTAQEDKIILSGGGFTYATIYAPTMNMAIQGSNNFAIGSVIVRSITITSGGGNGSVSYDTALSALPLSMATTPIIEASYLE